MLFSTIGRRALPACTCQPQLHAAAAVPSRLRTLATTRFARDASPGTAAAITPPARPPNTNAAGAPIPRVQASRTPSTPFTPPAVTTQDLERLSRPAPWQRGAQALGFVLSGRELAYADTLEYGERNRLIPRVLTCSIVPSPQSLARMLSCSTTSETGITASAECVKPFARLFRTRLCSSTDTSCSFACPSMSFPQIRQRFQGLQDQFFTVSEQDRQLRRSTSKHSSTAPATATKERLV